MEIQPQDGLPEEARQAIPPPRRSLDRCLWSLNHATRPDFGPAHTRLGGLRVSQWDGGVDMW